MNTKEFVAIQLAKPFEQRRIPDSLYLRNNTVTVSRGDLLVGRFPETAGYCFDNGFMYESYVRYIGAFNSLYPNIVITKEECLEYNRLCGAADG